MSQELTETAKAGDGTKRPNTREIVFSVLGALVILSSFIVKDVFRDQIKEKIGSIEGALGVYDAGDQLQRITAELSADSHAITVQLNRLLARQYVDSVSPELGVEYGNRDVAEDTFQTARYLWKMQEDTSSRLIVLMREMPVDWYKNPVSIKLVRKEFEQSRETFLSKMQKFHDDSQEAGVKDSERFQAEKKELLGCELVSIAYMQEFESAVKEMVWQEVKLNKQIYRTLTVVSYLLFIIGWALALAGKLFRIPGLAAAE